jgi:hypothetical protein
MGMRYETVAYLKSGFVCAGDGKYEWKTSKYEFELEIT